MNILVVSSYLPYPLFSGGHIRLYNLLQRLSKQHSIILVCEKRENQGSKEIEELSKICKTVIAVKRKKQWSVSNILRTGFSNDPFLITGHTNSHMQKKIREVLDKQKIDLIHVETSYVWQNLPITEIPTVLVEHNIEYRVYEKYKNKTFFLIRPLLSIDINKLKRFEESVWKKASSVIAVSEEEKQVIQQFNKKVEVVSNGVDLQHFAFFEKSKHQVEKKVLFIGDFKWIQNRDAAMFTVKKVWPLLQHHRDIKLWIVGKNIPASLKSICGQNIIFDEHADDTAKVFKEAFVLLAIIRVGGGTSYKILESMASGTPVITTSLGFSGILAEKDKDIIVTDDPNTMVKAIERLLEDSAYYQTIAKNARRVIEDKYNWNTIAEELDTVYKKTV